MHSSVPIGLIGNLNNNRDSTSSSFSNTSNSSTGGSNYSEFLWCSPNNNNSTSESSVNRSVVPIIPTDENYNNNNNENGGYRVISVGNVNEMESVSPQNANSHSSYYDFHTHPHLHHGGGLSQNGANNANERHHPHHHHHHLPNPFLGHHQHHHHQNYGVPVLDTLGSEAEECGNGPAEYYVTAARSPTDSAYGLWNNSSSTAHLAAVHERGIGTSVGHPSPEEDSMLISPNENPEDGIGIGEEEDGLGGLPLTPRPTPRRRNTANKKERRRTMSINNAFADLRDCIPNVPADTKLSKIKTLRLATSYIAYLSEVLSGDDPSRTPAAFTAEISRKLARGDDKRKKELLMAELNNCNNNHNSHHQHSQNNNNNNNSATIIHEHHHHRKTKGRTGWPQHVWALELQQ